MPTHEENPTTDIRALYRRASQWFAGHDYIDKAIQHALNAGDSDTAATIEK